MKFLRSLWVRLRSWGLADWVAVIMALTAVGGVTVSYMQYLDTRSSSGTSEEVPPAVRIRHIENAPEQKPDCEWEYVELINESDQVQDISYWTIEDEGAHYTYTFPEFELAPAATVRVWTAGAHSEENDLVWGGSQSVWNNDGDKATLRDGRGNEVDELTCGP